MKNIIPNKSLELAKLIILIRIIINHKDNINNHLTHIHLQKIMWFCYIENFKSGNKKALVDEEFQAWGYGPVLVSVYEEYREYGNKNIDDFFTYDQVQKWDIDVSDADFNLILKVFDDLDYKPAKYLIKKSHDEFWRKYNRQNTAVMPLEKVISFYGK